ncbi:hypothetical protein RYZ57_20460 [Enterobacter hormaechei]|uniref:hypothetical protein n=1 Tax=Enterobacter hormaechei TaxID=158836 RepID=UPI002965131D|nr:hypothetical protein [Enterobacter hormaechei]MDW2601515.1 hypothetical protein [Enterobacter hormaechei]
MELVRKKNKRGQFVRKLSLTEKVSLLQEFSNGRTASRVDRLLANNILDEMDRQELWVKCDCIELEQMEAGPFNCEVNAAKLRHVSKSRQHDENCPLFRLKKEKDADNTAVEGKTNPLNPVGENDWLPDRKKETQIIPVDGPSVPRKRRRKTLKPIPALGRKLLTLLQAAGLNQLELLPEFHRPGAGGAISRIKMVLEEHSTGNGTPLSKLCSCSPWLSLSQIDDMLKELEETQEKDKEPCVYIIGIASDVSAEDVTFTIKKHTYIHRPEARVRINGENSYNAGSRAPYWAILEYRRGRDRRIFCHEGYAHAAFSMDNPVPVDSNKERDTLKVILSACDFAGRQTNHPDAISCNKPLFTLKSVRNGEEEVIHPDFILNVLPAGKTKVTTYIIETMGYQSEEYLKRKRHTHSWMEQEGILLTDPPGWPGPSEKSFNSYLLKHIFGAGKTPQ